MTLSGLWTEATLALADLQRGLQERMTDAFDLAEAGGGAGLLIALAFAYGVLHAVGPGHGKAVLAGWLMARREEARRGIALALAGAALQGVVAIALVYGLAALAGLAGRETEQAARWSERASYVLVIATGAWLAWRGLAAALAARRTHAHGHDHDHDHAHHHAHGHDHAPRRGGDPHGAACGVCGHAHLPGPAAVARARGWRAQAALTVTIGLRPCAGAILLLVFAQVSGLALEGALAVAAMSLGTGGATAALAWAAVAARGRMTALAARAGAGAGLIAVAPPLAIGAALALFGALLLAASFAPRHGLAL